MLTCISDPKQFNDLYCNNFELKEMRYEWIEHRPGSRAALNLELSYHSEWSKQVLKVTFHSISRLNFETDFGCVNDLELVRIESILDQQIDGARYHVKCMFEFEDPQFDFWCRDFAAVLEDYSLK